MKHLLYILLFMVAFAGCTNENNDIVPEVNKKDCKVTFTISEVVLTRAASQIKEGTTIDILAYLVDDASTEATAETAKINYTVNADGTLSPTTAGAAMYLTLGKTYNFYAVTPVQTITDKSFDLTNSVEDYLKIASTGATRLTSPSQSLELQVFNHFGSAVLFNFKIKGEQKIIESIAINGIGIKLSGITQTPISFTLGDTEIDCSGKTIDDSFIIAPADVKEVAPDIEYNGTMFIMPKAEGPLTIEFNFQVNGKVENNASFKTITPPIVFEPKKKYVFSIEITDPKIYMKIGTIEWNDDVVLDEEQMGGTLNYFYANDWDISKIQWATDMGGGTGFPISDTPIGWYSTQEWQITTGGGTSFPIAETTWITQSWGSSQGDDTGFPLDPNSPGSWAGEYDWSTSIGQE